MEGQECTFHLHPPWGGIPPSSFLKWIFIEVLAIALEMFELYNDYIDPFSITPMAPPLSPTHSGPNFLTHDSGFVSISSFLFVSNHPHHLVSLTLLESTNQINPQSSQEPFSALFRPLGQQLDNCSFIMGLGRKWILPPQFHLLPWDLVFTRNKKWNRLISKCLLEKMCHLQPIRI